MRTLSEALTDGVRAVVCVACAALIGAMCAGWSPL